MTDKPHLLHNLSLGGGNNYACTTP